MPRPLRVLLVAPYYSQATPGESWSTYKWVEGISRFCKTTILTTHQAGWDPLSSPVQAEEIVNWNDLKLPRQLARLSYELKPGYLLFYLRARRWIRHRLRNGWNFDLVHQINPLAIRYPSPAAGLGLKYIIGPLAGSLETPPGFKNEGADRQWFRKLRHLDNFRLRHDPFLRPTYADAALVLGVAPYVQDLMASIKLRRFEIMCETGVESVVASPKKGPAPGEPFRLLFVGRIIRTKGILDAIRAVALAAKDCDVQFDVIGDGDLLSTCRQEAIRLGIATRVHFHGRLARQELSRWYQRAHLFLFPSFREPSGNVVFEAMSYGCPIITSTCGGPGYLVDDTCGMRVFPQDPDQFAEGLGTAIIRMVATPNKLSSASAAALARITKVAFWPEKMDQLAKFYGEVVGSNSATNLGSSAKLMGDKH